MSWSVRWSLHESGQGAGFSCGSEVALEIRQALGLSVHVELHGASSTDDHGRFAFANYHHLSNIADASFDRQFVDLITRLGIQVVFATHDSVLEHLAPLAQHNGVYLVNGDPQTAAVTRRKSATYALFNGQPWLPTLFASVEHVTEWPIVLKPDQGQGGQGVTVATDRQQAQQAFDAMCEPVLCEYLPGEELTVDCFTDWRQRLLHVGPRSRERVRAGITMRSRSVPCSDEIRGIAEGISERLSLRGLVLPDQTESAGSMAFAGGVRTSFQQQRGAARTRCESAPNGDPGLSPA